MQELEQSYIIDIDNEELIQNIDSIDFQKNFFYMKRNSRYPNKISFIMHPLSLKSELHVTQDGKNLYKSINLHFSLKIDKEKIVLPLNPKEKLTKDECNSIMETFKKVSKMERKFNNE